MFDLKIYLLCVEFDIDECYNYILDISLLVICIFGLLGEQYLVLNVGFEDLDFGMIIFKDGGIIQDIKFVMVLEDLIGQFFYNSKGGDNQNFGNDKVEVEGYIDVMLVVGMMY